MNRVLSVVLVLILLTAGGAFLLMPNLLSGELKQSVPYSLIPDDAAFVLEINNCRDAELRIQAQEYGASLFATTLGQSYSNVKKLRSNIFASHFAANTMDSTYLGISVHLSQYDEYEAVFYSRLNENAIEEMEASVLSLGANSHISDKSSVYQLELDGKKFAFAFLQDFLVMSASTSLVESSAAMLAGSGSSILSPSFEKILTKRNEQALISVMLQYKGLASLASVYANNAFQKSFKSLASFGDWTGFEIFPSDEGLQLSGFSASGKDLAFLSKNQAADHDELAKVLSSRTLWFLHKAVSQDDSLGLFNSVAWTMTEPLDTSFGKYIFTYLSIADEEATKLKLEPTGEQLGSIDLEVYNSMDLAAHSLGNKGRFGIIHEGYLILGESVSDLNRLCRVFSAGSNLADDLRYQEFAKNANSKSDMQLYFNAASSEKLFAQYGQSFWKEESIEGGRSWFQLFSPLFVSWSNNSDVIFTNSFLRYGDEITTSAEGELWSYELDTSGSNEPHLIYNYSSKLYEVLVQDDGHTIYHFSTSGALRWKRSLDGPIIGGVGELDFYKNDKIQYIFNTAKRIYILDRKGRDVANYPLNLPADAIAALSVVNYGGNKNYRFFVPTADAVYGFESTGKPLNGWRPRSDLGNLVRPIAHYDVEGKDFLVCLNKEGEMSFLNRKGKERINTIQTLNSNDWIWNEEHNTWTACDSIGFFNVDATGKIARPEPNYSRFDFNMFFQAESGLCLFKIDTTNLSFLLKGGVNVEHKGLINGNYKYGLVQSKGLSESWIYAHNVEQDMIYIMTTKGQILEPFPMLAGSVPVIGNLYKDNKAVMVIINGNKVIAKTL